jgi:hypothetical protein
LPDAYDSYSLGNDSIPELIVRRVRIQATEINTEWIYAVSWGQIGSEDPQNNDPDPTNWATKYRMEWRNEIRTLDTDKDGLPIVNSANLAFDPPKAVEESYPVFIAERWEKNYQAIVQKAILYANAKNTDKVYYASIGQALMRPITFGDPMIRNGHKVFPVTYRVALKAPGETWDESYPNIGMTAKSAPAGEHEQPLDDRLNAVTGPFLLAADGTKLPSGGTVTYAGPFRTRNQQPFSPLGL